MKKLFLILGLAIIAVSCSTTQPLYNWKGYDEAVYAYIDKSSDKSVENLIAVYEKLINKPDGSRRIPPPGVCADYGYLLLQKGEVEKGKELLVAETTYYPESKPFIDRILKRFE